MVYVLMWKTVLGYRLRAVGENPSAAKFAGINVELNIVLAMFISGGLAGLAGACEVAGLRGYLISDLSPGYGYTGIAVALLGGLNPAAVMLATVFFASLIVGADGLQRSVGVPTATVQIIQGLVLVGYVGSWDDPAKALELAQSMIDNGADVLSHKAGGSGVGVMKAAESAGVWAINDVTTCKDVAPNWCLTSTDIKFDVVVLKVVEMAQQGQLKGEIYNWGIKDSAVDIGPISDKVRKIPLIRSWPCANRLLTVLW